MLNLVTINKQPTKDPDKVPSTLKIINQSLEDLNQSIEPLPGQVLQGGMTGIQWVGERMEDLDKSVTVRSLVNMNPANRLMSAVGVKPPEPKWLSPILNYSVHDARGHLAGGAGNVAGTGARLLGADQQTSEQINDAAEFVAQLAIPQTADFAAGAGYYKRLLTKAPELTRLAIKAGDVINTKAWRGLDNILNPELALAGVRATTKDIPQITQLNKLGSNVLKIDPGAATVAGGGVTRAARIDQANLGRRTELANQGEGFKLTRKEFRELTNKARQEGWDVDDIRKRYLAGETFWIDDVTGENIALHRDKKNPLNVKFVGQWSRGTRGPKRVKMTKYQTMATGENVFIAYDHKTNKVALGVQKGDEIHHWNSLIDKSSAYVDLTEAQAKKLTSMIRKEGWFFGDKGENLIKMPKDAHLQIHTWMIENDIQGAKAVKRMEKFYKGKSLKERVAILKGYMEYVQGGVDEELIRMGYTMPKAQKAAQEINSAAQRKYIKGK